MKKLLLTIPIILILTCNLYGEYQEIIVDIPETVITVNKARVISIIMNNEQQMGSVTMTPGYLSEGSFVAVNDNPVLKDTTLSMQGEAYQAIVGATTNPEVFMAILQQTIQGGGGE